MGKTVNGAYFSARHAMESDSKLKQMDQKSPVSDLQNFIASNISKSISKEYVLLPNLHTVFVFCYSSESIV